MCIICESWKLLLSSELWSFENFLMNDSDRRFCELFLMDIFFTRLDIFHTKCERSPNDATRYKSLYYGRRCHGMWKIFISHSCPFSFFFSFKEWYFKKWFKSSTVPTTKNQHNTFHAQHLNSHDRPLFSHNSTENMARDLSCCCSGWSNFEGGEVAWIGVHNSVVC